MHHLILLEDAERPEQLTPLDMEVGGQIVNIRDIDPTFTIDESFPETTFVAGDITMADVPLLRTMHRASFAGPPGQVLAFLDWQKSMGRFTYEWDPEITTCIARPRGPHRDPIAGWGTWEDVQRQNQYARLQAEGCTGQDVYIVMIDEGICPDELLERSPTPFRDAGFWHQKFYAPGPLGSGAELAERILTGFDGPVKGIPRHLSAPRGTHGTMMTFDTAILAPEARIVDLPAVVVGEPFPRLLSGVTLVLERLMGILDEHRKETGTVPSIVINNSWQMVDPAANGAWEFSHPHSSFNLTIEKAAAEKNIDVIFAAGNCGRRGVCRRPGADTIYGANSLEKVLTVSAANVHGAFVRVSSRGRGWIDETKPDICNSSYFEGSGVWVFDEKRSPRVVDGGTSAACAVTSGLVAAIRSKWSQNRLPPNSKAKGAPPGLFDYLRKSARAKYDKDYGKNHDACFGYGIVDVERLLADLENNYA